MSDVIFKSRLCRPVTVSCPMGNGERSIYEERFENGRRVLKIVGKENLKDYIEASKQDTLISNIIKRFEAGDVSVLSRSQGFYGDVSQMPTSLSEAQNLLIKLERDFNNLSPDVREHFDNSFDRYVSEVSKFSVDDFNRVVLGRTSDSAVKSDNIVNKEDDSNE